MKSKKLLVAAALTILLPLSLSFAQVSTSNNKATAKDKLADVKKPITKKAGRATEPEVPLSDARIAFDYTVFDFGTVPNGAYMTHNFPVSNIGPDTLYITKIKAG
jgi:hypothetical protein